VVRELYTSPDAARSHKVRPRPTVLFALPPLGLGSDQVESLTSYVRRLSAKHVVSPVSLLRGLVFEPSGRSIDPAALKGALNGATLATELVVCRLIELTGVPEVRSCTLLAVRDVLGLRRGFADRRRWCPRCLAESEPYDRLSWAISVVWSCAVHHSQLRDSCACCGRAHFPLHPLSSPTACPFCGALLVGGPEPSRPEDRLRDLASELLERVQRGVPIDPAAFQLGIRTASASGGRSQFASAAGVSDACLKALLRSGRHRPEIGTVLKIVAASGQRLDEFLGGLRTFRSNRAKRSQGVAIVRGRTARLPRTKVNPARLQQIQGALDHALSVPEIETPTIAELMRRCGVSRELLMARFPRQYRELLASRHRRALRQLASARAGLAAALAKPAAERPTLVAFSHECGVSTGFLTRRFPQQARDLARSRGLRGQARIVSVRALVANALSKSDANRPTINELGRHARVSAFFIKHHFPEETAELIASGRRRSDLARLERENRLAEAIHRAALSAPDAVPPTLSRLERRLGSQRIFMNRRFRDIARKVIEEQLGVIRLGTTGE